MNKKQIETLSGVGILFLIVAAVLGIIVQSGASHPPLRFPSIAEQTASFIMDMAKREYKDANVSLLTQGPFKWENEKDLGVSKLLGEWSKEFDHDAVVYFRRDKDAEWQEKAQTVLSQIDRISEDLSGLLGKICCVSDSANGRKLPIYLPEDDQEYMQVLEKLCDGRMTPTNKKGGSVIGIGPLGCKDDGIVIHPDAFADPKDYEAVLRREMARYAYLSSVDFNEVIDHQSWFTEGFVELFGAGAETVESFSKETIDLLEREFSLERSGAGGKDITPEMGAAFLRYISSSLGEEKLTELIQDSFKVSLDSAFVAMGLDFQEVKSDWINSLRMIEEEAQLQ